MKKTQLYTLTLIAVSIVVLLISIASSYYLYNASKDKLWEAKLESGEREAREIANLLEQQLNSGLNQQQVIQNLQKSIENTDFKSDFICMYNQKEIELCHPNPSFIGKVIEDDNSDLIDIKNNKNNTFRKVLEAGKKDNGLRTFSKEKQRNSEIVNVYPVPKTDWMVASHANLKVMQEQLSDLFLQFLLSLLLSTLIITISCYVLIRLIYKKYESNMELEIVQLNNEVNELQILNKQLNSYQEKLQTIKPMRLFLIILKLRKKE